MNKEKTFDNDNGTEKLLRVEKLSPKEKTTGKSEMQIDLDHREKSKAVAKEMEKEGKLKLKTQYKKTEKGQPVELTLTPTLGVASKHRTWDLKRTALWSLLAAGQMTMSEVEEFEAKNKDKMTYNELMALDLLRSSLAGDKEARNLFWATQAKMMTAKSLSGIKVDVEVKPDSTMTKLLDQITQNIVDITPSDEDVAQEAEIL